MLESGENVYELGPPDAPGSRSRILVAPGLNGRLLTSRVGEVESVGYVNREAIRRGAVDPAFNNFGGQDRLWIGPEAEAFGFYFEPGAPFDREVWRVPAPLNEGGMEVLSMESDRIRMGRELQLVNHSGHEFRIGLEREVGVLDPESLNEEIGIPLPGGVELCASYSLNTITNRGEEAWSHETGLPAIWILGQYNAGERTIILAPFRAGRDEDLGPPFFDDYFGKVSEETPERLVVLDSTVIFRADARREGKFGLGARRTTGFAGSYDPDLDLLLVCKFDSDPEARFQPAYTWLENNPRPFSGDAFQAYNADRASNPENTFYELESASPALELAPGESLTHRHAVFAFQGPRTLLDPIAREILGVGLDEALARMP